MIRRSEWSNTSLVLKLFTRELGAVDCVAKGARRPKSSFKSFFDLLSLNEAVLLVKSGSELSILAEAEHTEIFGFAGAGPDGLLAASALVELLRLFGQMHKADEEIFDMSVTFGRRPVPALWEKLLAYQIKLLGAGGFFPDFTHCPECHAEVAAAAAVEYDTRFGRFACRACGRGTSDETVRFDRPKKEIVGRIGARSFEALDRVRLAPPLLLEMQGFLAAYFRQVLGQPVRTLSEVLHRLRALAVAARNRTAERKREK